MLGRVLKWWRYRSSVASSVCGQRPATTRFRDALVQGYVQYGIHLFWLGQTLRHLHTLGSRSACSTALFLTLSHLCCVANGEMRTSLNRSIAPEHGTIAIHARRLCVDGERWGLYVCIERPP